MTTSILSQSDQPAHSEYYRWGVSIKMLLLLGVVLFPFLSSSFRGMDVLVKIMIFTIVVASYDLIVGFTGILTFAHGMFFGIGAYSLALILYHTSDAQWYHIVLAVLVAIVISVVLSLTIALFSLRVKAIYFTLITLAVAEFVFILSVGWTDLTMGEDGIFYNLPGILDPGWSVGRIGAAQINGQLMCYYLILIAAILLFRMMLRFVRSPTGRVLQAVRDNEQRATALGYKVFHYQLFSSVFGSVISAMAGVLFAIWMSFVSPDSTLGLLPMFNIILMLIIGGLGTLYGSIVGAAFIKVTETWLPDLQKLAETFFPNTEILYNLAERWMLFLGILFILIVIFFPMGVYGTIRYRISGTLFPE